jgi:hypothetical protein
MEGMHPDMALEAIAQSGDLPLNIQTVKNVPPLEQADFCFSLFTTS